MWSFLKGMIIPGFFLMLGLDGLINRPSDSWLMSLLALLVGLAGTWVVWRATIGAPEAVSSPAPAQSHTMACLMCGYYSPKHPLTRCHYCLNPTAYPAPDCICEKCALDRYYAYGGE